MLVFFVVVDLLCECWEGIVAARHWKFAPRHRVMLVFVFGIILPKTLTSVTTMEACNM
jgi:hypothetical protein